MKFISWNVNGLRACMGKGFMDFFNEIDADILCLQETKLQEGQIELDIPGYFQYWNYAEKKGYSGTAVFTKKEPISVTYGIGIEDRHVVVGDAVGGHTAFVAECQVKPVARCGHGFCLCHHGDGGQQHGCH